RGIDDLQALQRCFDFVEALSCGICERLPFKNSQVHANFSRKITDSQKRQIRWVSWLAGREGRQKIARDTTPREAGMATPLLVSARTLA
ncbi:hypothetical protein, partial [Ralstonia sp.]|uniref:hypothetical protein n=1 Tax=Ralstonia sp. TaxID=54061 RepID=UPI00257D5202